jgi:imidazolonepropionase-like amidohydrolase
LSSSKSLKRHPSNAKIPAMAKDFGTGGISMRNIVILFLVLVLALAAIPVAPLLAQSSAAPASRRIAIRAGKLIDGKSDNPVANALILVEDGKIASVTPGGAPPSGAEFIDLSNATVLPGLIDAHTHILLQGDVTEEDYAVQLLKESIPYRTMLASRNVKIALDHGFTALRDLETEGAMYADMDVKKAINDGVIPGPRLFVSTRAMAPTGMYPLLGYAWELDMPHGVQPVDGVEGARLAVREQLSHGADWIKYYSDHGYHYGDDGILHGIVNFTDDEAHAIVDETHRLGHRVAAHCISSDGIAAALRAGVDSVEHGDGMTESEAEDIAHKGVYWVPTVMVGAAVAPGRGGNWGKMVNSEREAFGRALKNHVKIVFGTDVGGFAWTDLNETLEFHYYVDYGMTPMQAIRTATTGAAELLNASDRMGSIEAGKYADIIAVSGDPLKDITVLDHVGFVMKAGTVYKNELK